jgi:para-aminobenzoate synthetase component I
MNVLGKQREPFLFILDFDLAKPLFFPLKNIQKSTEIVFDINGIRNFTPLSIKSPKAVFFNKKPILYTDYKAKFDFVLENLQIGNSFLVNLTQPTAIETNLSLSEIFHNCTAKYKLLVNTETDKFVVFSPEPFVKIDETGIISSFPMKGTMDAGIENAEIKLMNDVKEQAEHATIVDLIRNDLSQVASKVRVERYRFVERVKTHDKELLQVSSKISGQLPSDFLENIGTIFQKLLPAGSISGAPKPKTVEIIKTAEGYERGYYTGIVGIFDGKRLDSGVMIRFIEQNLAQNDNYTEGGLIFKSGGGITAMSDAESEYLEMIDKVYVPIITRNTAHHQRSVTACELA